MLWLLLSSLLLLVTLLPACVFLLSRGLRLQKTLITAENWFSVVIIHTTAWVLILFSLAFGPSAGTIPQVCGSSAPTGMEKMIEEASQIVDQRHLFGRGGILGNLDFAGFRNLEVQGNQEAPLFASRRPHHTVSLAAYLCLQLGIYLCAVLSVLAVASSSGAKPGRALLFSMLWGSLVYAPAVHWVWGEGWLGVRGAIDTGGSLFMLIVCGSILGIWRTRTTDQEPGSPWAGWDSVILHLSATAFVLGYLILMCTLSVPSAHLRAIAFLNGIAAACGGFLFYYLMQFLTSNRTGQHTPLVGCCCGIISAAAGCTILDSQTAFTCGVFGGAAGFLAWTVALRFRCSQPLEFAFATTASAMLGLLMVGCCGSSSYGVMDWNGTPISSLMHGDNSQIKAQALMSITVLAYVFTLSKLLGKVCLRPTADSVISQN